MKILQIGQTAQGAGVENAVRLISSGLARANHRVHLVTDSTRYADEFRDVGVATALTDLSDRSVQGYWAASRTVRRLLKDFQPDIVHVHGRSHTLIALLAGRRPDCFTLHNSHFTHRMGVLDHDWLRPLFPRAKRTIVICKESISYVQNIMGLDGEHVELVYNGIDCSEFRPPSDQERVAAREKFGVAPDQILAVFVGRFHEQKQPHALVELAQALKSAALDHVRIAIVGGGDLLAELEATIEHVGVGDICKIYPWMTDPSVAYWAADVSLLPSLHEGFGLAVVEAMACSCPVIRTRTGGWEAMIKEGVTGFSTPIETSEFVKTTLPQIKDKTTLERMRTSARNHAVEELSIERSVENTLAVYQSVLSAG